MKPLDYLTSVKSLLLNSPLIASHQIMREYEGLQKGYIRVRLTFTNDSVLEFAEYVEAKSESEIEIADYSYHWMNKDGSLIRRWDNTRHFPKLKNFPHHIHISADKVISGKPIDIFGVLDEIGKIIGES